MCMPSPHGRLETQGINRVRCHHRVPDTFWCRNGILSLLLAVAFTLAFPVLRGSFVTSVVFWLCFHREFRLNLDYAQIQSGCVGIETPDCAKKCSSDFQHHDHGFAHLLPESTVLDALRIPTSLALTTAQVKL